MYVKIEYGGAMWPKDANVRIARVVQLGYEIRYRKRMVNTVVNLRKT
jgi:hypothetical protein